MLCMPCPPSWCHQWHPGSSPPPPLPLHHTPTGNQAPLHQRRLQQRSTAIPTTLNITRILPALTTLITPPTPSTPAPARESLPVSPTPTNTSATPAGNTVSQPSANQTTLSPTPAPESTTAPAVPVITTSAPTSTHNASNLEPEASSAGATTAEPASPPAGVEGGVAGSEVGKVPPCPARIADDCCNEEVVASEQCNALG